LSREISTETVVELVDVLPIDAFIVVEGTAIEGELVENYL
jgi:hypothetical protein